MRKKKITYKCSCGTTIKLPVDQAPIGSAPRCPLSGSGDQDKHEVTMVTALARRDKSGLAKRKRRKKREEGLVAIKDMKGAMSDLFKPDLLLPGRALVDEEGNMLAESPGLHIDPEFLDQPQITNVKLDADGNVTGMDVKPREWPPRNEKF